MGINHSFMEVPDGVDETCVLLVFCFLTQITGIFSGGDDWSRGGKGSILPLSVMESRQHGAMRSILDDDNKAGVGTWSNYR